MNIKTLTLLFWACSIFGSVGAAEARPSDCWSNSGNNTVLQHFDCDVSRYQSKGDFNWNGTYFLIEDFGRVFLSEDGEAKIIFDGGRTLYYTWGYDDDGDVRIYGKNGYEFSFRI